MAGKLKQRHSEQGPRLKSHDTAKQTPNQMRPKFSLEYLQKGYCLSDCTKDEKAAFADRLHELSQLTWQQIQQAGRHKQGFEKIPSESIKSGIPPCITDDVVIMAFRFCGLAPMVGFRRDEVFFAVWLDRDFTLYDHG